MAKNRYSITEMQQIKALQISYQNYLEAKAKLNIYDSIFKVYEAFSQMAKRKFEEGESNYLEKITAESKASQIELEMTQLQQIVQSSYLSIKGLLQIEDYFDFKR